ncbi:TPA: hypothetical protein PXD21_002189, partial [Mannheimia haemolytica]|nr:hypothetical protein [Mannheimia haemolytica]
IFLFIYLKKLDKSFLFINLLNDKLLHALTLTSLCIILTFILYSTPPSIWFKEKCKTHISKKTKWLFILDIIVINITMMFFVFYTSLLKIERNEWDKCLYLFNGFIGIYMVLLFIYLRWWWYRQKDLSLTIEGMFIECLSLISCLLQPIFVLSIGINSENNISFWEAIFLFWLTPLIILIITTYLIIFDNSKTINIALTLIIILLWICTVFNMTPLVMSFIGVKEKIDKNYIINKQYYMTGKILLNQGEKFIFLEKGKLYNESIVIDKENIKLEDSN